MWLTQAQMVELFQSSKATISEHIKHIIEDDELDANSTVRKFRTVQQEGKRQVSRIVAYYNLDMIISVGYRVNTKRGIRFRQWANSVLKQYLVKGYAINENIRKHQIAELRQLIQVLGRAIQQQPAKTTDESNALFDVVVDYTYALDTLDNYDYQRLHIAKTTKEEPFHATYENAMHEIDMLRQKFGGSVLFGNERISPSKVLSDKSIRPLMAQNFIRVWRRKRLCFSILSPRTTRSAMVTSALQLPSSSGS